MITAVRRWSPRLVPAVLLAAAGWVIWRELQTLNAGDVAGEMLAWGPARLAAAAALTAAGFGLLAVLEWLGLRWAGARVPFPAALFGSFCANAFAHSIGLALVVGTAVRLRLYGRHGASLWMVGQTSLFSGVAFALGVCLLGGLSLLATPTPALAGLHLDPLAARGLGLGLIAAAGAYVCACAFLRGSARIAGRDVALPPVGAALAQAGLGLVDCALAALLVWLLLPAGSAPYPAFAGAYVVATLAGLASAVPGGAGVFEGVMLALSPNLARAPLAAALVGYRLIYYLAPLLVAAVLLARSDLAARRMARFAAIWRSLAPLALSLAAFALGAVLILTGIGRIEPERLAILQANVPVLILETSHMLSLVSGLALMATSLGLFRGRARAVPIAAAAAAIGASTALLRGLDIGPAVAAAVLGGAVLLSRRAFKRKGSWSSTRLAPLWAIGGLAVLVGAIALGLWVYSDTPYETRLWLKIGYPADPARFLRSVALLGSALLVAGAWLLARAGGPTVQPADALALQAIRALVESRPDTTARLALSGDKALLRAPGDTAFIMYAAEGRSLIAMGDPVGDAEAGRALLWKFKELAHAADARLAIYHASPRWLTDYLDLGLSLVKVGEEARVSLPDFTLEGPHRRNLRQGRAKAIRDGLSFSVVLPPIDAALLDALRDVSDAWLVERGGHEKGFSLGFFNPDTLRQEPIALVRSEGRIVAFANIWTGARSEASVDLMRHLPEAPRGVMDFLFVELIVWAKAEGFEWFNLGMAPLAGLAEHPLAPLWHKLGGQVARRGSRYYSFLGLRAFKAKFDPVWTPRYLAASPTALAAAMLDVTRLIGRPRRPGLTKP